MVFQVLDVLKLKTFILPWFFPYWVVYFWFLCCSPQLTEMCLFWMVWFKSQRGMNVHIKKWLFISYFAWFPTQRRSMEEEVVEVEVMAKDEQLRLDHNVFLKSWCIPFGSWHLDSDLYFYDHNIFMKSWLFYSIAWCSIHIFELCRGID